MEEELIEIRNESNDIVNIANNINITSQEDLEQAAGFLKAIKDTQKRIKEYWQEPIKNAYETHKKLKAKENEMLEPLQNSEKIIKNKVADYNLYMEQLKREEEQRIKAEQERQALEQLQEAERLRAEGNEVEAQIVEENAIAMNQVEVSVDSGIEKVEGLSFRKDYEITITDATKVPAYINGTELRKIDLTQIKRFVKMTNNGVQIPRNTSKRN
jgi:hypothetical protein